jgi:hypothetical protein
MRIFQEAQVLFHVVADMHTAQLMPALTNMRFRAGSSRRLGLCTRDRGQCESAETQ